MVPQNAFTVKFELSAAEKLIISSDVKRAYEIKDYKGDGIVMDTDSVIEKIENAMNDILFNNGKKTDILKDGNGKIDSDVLCQAIFPVITCPCHCKGCYAVNDCTKKFQGRGKQTAECWYKWYFIEKFYPDAYFLQIDRELSKSNSVECRWHVSGDFMDNSDVVRCIEVFKKYPGIKFYTYTKRDAKRDNMPALTELYAMENVNIVDSRPCGMKNYGDAEYLEKLKKLIKEQTGIDPIVCQCGTKTEKDFNTSHKKANGGDGHKYCGGCCKACRDNPYILFIEHK